MDTVEPAVAQRVLRTAPDAAPKDVTLPGYICPDCKAALVHLYCPGCRYEFQSTEGVPCFLSREPRFARAQAIAAQYDALYSAESGVWENQGRTAAFIQYFAMLLEGCPGERFLEIGCGEGFLLSAVGKREKYAVDLSLQALRRARSKTQANFSLALGERLPFPAHYFDVIASVGVMEHFLDIPETLREVRRVLRPGGHYVTLTHVRLTMPERVMAKLAEFVFPWPAPIGFARWVQQKITTNLPRQPVQNRYTTEGAMAYLTAAGLNVRDVLHRRRREELPFIGPYVVVYVAQG